MFRLTDGRTDDDEANADRHQQPTPTRMYHTLPSANTQSTPYIQQPPHIKTTSIITQPQEERVKHVQQKKTAAGCKMVLLQQPRGSRNFREEHRPASPTHPDRQDKTRHSRQHNAASSSRPKYQESCASNNFRTIVGDACKHGRYFFLPILNCHKKHEKLSDRLVKISKEKIDSHRQLSSRPRAILV